MSRAAQKRQAIDWQRARERLARVAAATEETLQLSPERARALLEERARALARVPVPAPLAGEILEVVTFSLGEERYAIETRHVRGVVRLGEWTPVPGGPDFLVGVINLRGEILALLDLRPFFGLGKQPATEHSRILVLGGERIEFGVLADAAHEVRTLRIDQILEPPASLTGHGQEYLRGVTADTLIVLDGTLLLQDRRLYIDQDSSPAGRN